MKIKIFEKTQECMPQDFKVGEWYDLKTAEDITLKAPYAKTLHYKTKGNKVEEKYRDVVFHHTLIPLGVCMEIPKGYEALLTPRSSTFLKYGILQTNSIGIIDNLYSSEEDEWKMPVVATRHVTIPAGTRIAQFRIQLSQKASWWQKLKWLFSSCPELKKVKHLNNPTRGGFGKGTDK